MILLITTLLIHSYHSAQRGRVTVGEIQIWFVLIILFLRLALSIRTTPKETGALLGIQESSALIVLLLINLLAIIDIPKETGAFGELKIVFANYTT